MIDDLPVARRGDDLPELLECLAPVEQFVEPPAELRAWRNWAGRRHVRGLSVTPGGEVWLATAGGVVCWHPARLHLVCYRSEHGLPGNSVTAVAHDGAGRAWALSQGDGLSWLEGRRWQPYDRLGGARPVCLARDGAGRLWVAGPGGVHALGEPGAGPAAALPPPALAPRALAVTDEGHVWLCAERGVYVHRGDHWTPWSDWVTVLTLLWHRQVLWLGTETGLVGVDAAGRAGRHPDCPLGEVPALAPAADGVWAVIGHSVGRATPAGWAPLPGELRARATALADGGDGTVLVATHVGLFRGGPGGLRPVLPETRGEMPGCLVQSLAVERGPGGALWVGTTRGLFRLDAGGEVGQVLGHAALRDVRALAVLADGVWAADWGRGLAFLRGQTLVRQEPTVPAPIFALADGEPCWAAGPAGLHCGTPAGWSLELPIDRYSEDGGLRALAAEPGGLLWVGIDEGLWSLEPGRKTMEREDRLPAGADVRTLLVVAAGAAPRLWVGTGAGLYGGPPRGLKEIPALRGHAVTALAWDGEAGALWVGTTAGLFRLAPQGDGWQVGEALTPRNSGLAADRVTALALGGAALWVGTPCGLSRYRIPRQDHCHE
jgi:ligand-binding sensor domain-containing protein